MIRAQFTDYITVQDGMVVRYVEARWPETKTRLAGHVTVYRINDLGMEQVRYLDYRPICGYMVDLDFEDDTWFNVSGTYRALRTGANVCSSPLTDQETQAILMVYPEFKWTLQKAGKVNPAQAMKLLTAWKKDPRTELLVGAHLDNLVANGNFLRMKNERQKAVLAFIRKTPEAERWTLAKILFVMHRHSPEEYDGWQRFRSSYGLGCAFDVFKYLDGNRHALDMYNDYIHTAERCGHDIKDDYWKFPKNLKKAHDKVMKEYNRIQEARRLAEKAAATKREREKKKNFEKVVGKWLKKKLRKNGLVVSVPEDLKIVHRQAKILHQCLESCDYIGKMAEERCLLVFVATREGVPVATAEILPNGKIGQFYGDELSRDAEKMKPGKKAREALDAWLDKFKPRWRKAA